MNKQQVKVFEELLGDPNFMGKKQLRHLLWLNTVKPKFKVGQFVTVTNYSHRICGHQVIDFRAKVVKHNAFINTNEWHYELEMEITCNGKTQTIKEYASESDLKGGVRNNKNLLISKNGEQGESLDVRF